MINPSHLENKNFNDYLCNETNYRFEFKGVSSFEVMKIIKSLESKTSKGIDDFSAKFIKSIGDSIN